MAIVPLARADDRIYWVDTGSETISFANVDGFSGGRFETGKLSVDHPTGLAFDIGASRIYWANSTTKKISFANLAGPGGANLDTGGLPAAIGLTSGLVLDAAAGQIYWAKENRNAIAFANLDGSFSDNLPIASAALQRPSAVVLDRPSSRLYWTNSKGGSNPVSYANADGSGGGSVPIGNLPPFGTGSVGLAIDHANGRVYWAEPFANKIWYADLGGGEAHELPTGSATVSEPWGLALDPVAGRVYWANAHVGKLSFANVDGSGGRDLEISGVTPQRPQVPVLLFAPRPETPPTISGGTRAGATLSCSQGTWAPDHLESSLYEAPGSFSYQWSRDGEDIAGATASSLDHGLLSGDYRCRVTAKNPAGTATQASPPHHLSKLTFGKQTRVVLKLASGRASSHGQIAIQVANANDFAISGRLSFGEGVAGRKRVGKSKGVPFKVGPGSKAVVKLPLPSSSRRLLAQQKRLSLVVRATVTDPGGKHRTVETKVVLRQGR